MALTFLPFAETAPTDDRQLHEVHRQAADGFASWGFTSGLLFEQAAKAWSEVGNNGSPGRPADKLAKIHDFNASGMVGTTDIGNKVPSNCFMMEQFKNGKFVRVYPTKKGEFDCKASNLCTFKDDLNK